jgi:tetratricopeptide (TPR) repeat protein
MSPKRSLGGVLILLAMAGGAALGAEPGAATPADRAKSLKAKGDFLKEAGQLDDAAVAYKDALLSDPSMTAAREALSLLLARTGRYDEALLELEEGMKRDPKWKLGLLLEARVNQMAARWPEAVTLYRLYLGTKKKDPDALRGLADSLAEMGERKAAIATYGEYIKAEKRKSEAPTVARAKEAIAKLAAGPDAGKVEFEAVGEKPPGKGAVPGSGAKDGTKGSGEPGAMAAPAEPPLMPFPPKSDVPEARDPKPLMPFPPKSDVPEARDPKPLMPFPPKSDVPEARDPKPLMPFPPKSDVPEARDPKPLMPFPPKSDAPEARDPKPLMPFPAVASTARDPKPLLPFPVAGAAAHRESGRPLMPFPEKPTRASSDTEPKALGMLPLDPALPSALPDLPTEPRRPAAPVEPPTVDVSGDLAAGDLAFSRGDYRTAEMLYTGAAEDAHYHAEAWYKAGAARLLLGKVDPAIDAWKRALALDPENVGLRDKLERLYELRERMVKFSVLEPAKGPPPPEMRLIGAEDLLAAGRAGAALVEIDAVLAKREGSADGLFARGHALVSLGRYDEAAESYRLARAAEPEWAAPLKALGDVYRRMGDERLARYYYELFLAAAEHSSRAEDSAEVPTVKAILGH